MDLSIITVNTNDSDRILDQIASVKDGAKGLDYEQIITDNGSTDGSIEQIQKKFPDVKIILNNKNLGFGVANNIAAKNSTGRYLLFLNPDMRVMPGSLKKITDWMETQSKVGIAGCRLTHENGDLNIGATPRRFPTLFDQVVILLKLNHLFPSLLNKYLYHDIYHDKEVEKEVEVDSVRGSFMLMRRELYDKLDWAFDPRYFIWFEDVNTCREAKRLGYKVIYTPIISCVDYVGQTFKNLSTVQKQKWFTDSMLKYFKKWQPWYQWLIILILRPVGIIFVRFHALLKSN